jgi:hypothetical protein
MVDDITVFNIIVPAILFDTHVGSKGKEKLGVGKSYIQLDKDRGPK